MGRPTKYEEWMAPEIEYMAEIGMTMKQIAGALCVNRSSVYNWLQDEEVFRHYQAGKNKGIKHVAGILRQKIDEGDTTSTIFYLKTQAKWSERPEVEVSDSGKFSEAHRDELSRDDREQFRAIAKGILQTLGDDAGAPRNDAGGES